MREPMKVWDRPHLQAPRRHTFPTVRIKLHPIVCGGIHSVSGLERRLGGCLRRRHRRGTGGQAYPKWPGADRRRTARVRDRLRATVDRRDDPRGLSEPARWARLRGAGGARRGRPAGSSPLPSLRRDRQVRRRLSLHRVSPVSQNSKPLIVPAVDEVLHPEVLRHLVEVIHHRSVLKQRLVLLRIRHQYVVQSSESIP